MKKKLFRIFEILLFVILLIFFTNRIALVKESYAYDDNPGRNVRLFFELPKDTVDVVFAGDSHSFCSVIPQRIFDETGISAASIATPTQFITNTYWMLKDAIKQQDFKVFVIELHAIEHSLRESPTEAQFITGLIMMPDLSINKLRGFYDTKDTDFGRCSQIKIDSIYPLLQFNSDYGREKGSLLKLIDFTLNPGKHFKTFGYFPQTGVIPQEKLSTGIETDVDMYDTHVYEYLKMILDLCKENDIELVLMRTPYYSAAARANVYKDVIDWAKANNVGVIDFFEEDIGIDLLTDFRDNTHLNYNGAKKVSTYLGKYLSSHYDLADHRGDSKYSLWQNNDYDYSAVEAEMEENIRNSK